MNMLRFFSPGSLACRAAAAAATAVPLRSSILGKASGRVLSTSAVKKQLLKTLLEDKEKEYGFARSNPRPKKPRSRGLTEIRGQYYFVQLTAHFLRLGGLLN
jgi:hypothetical protein